MLDEYKESQPLFYNLVRNSLKDEFLSHAYLIDENNNPDSFKIVLSFVKEIFYKNYDYDRDIISKRIDDNNYPELTIIEPDGAFIKKEQLLNLQSDFSKMSLEGTTRVYIIRNADRMKKEAENSILKFLEEPNPNIVAILMTNNVNNLLETIISRCQFVKLNNENDTIYNKDLYDKALEYIMYIESDYEKLLVNSKKIWYDIVKEREDNYQLLGYMIDVYKDILHVKLGMDSDLDNSKVKIIIENNSIDKLNNKLKILLEYYDNIRNNVHIPMFLDSMIIELVGV